MNQKKLFLIDAYALIFRGYYAFIKNPRINSKGMDTSAILGFMNALLDVIKREKPDHLAVAFDKGGSHLRSDLYPEYKANRQETPEAIRLAVPYIHKILEAMRIPIVEKEGFEADDLIGTIAKQAAGKNYTVFMVTPDKDFAQLVGENVFLYKPSRAGNGVEIWGIPEVQKKFGVEQPVQVTDYLGMMGDSIDNIPGLPGVGEKTAKKFLSEYGSLENLLEHAADIKGKLGEKIAANKELGILSKKLATIITDAPVEFHEENYRMSQPDLSGIKAIFDELEFRRMWKSFAGLYASAGESQANENPEKKNISQSISEGTQLDLFAAAADEKTVSTGSAGTGFTDLLHTDHHYQYLPTRKGRKLLLEELMRQRVVAIDTETTGLDTFSAEIVGISFSYEKRKGYYVPLPADPDEAAGILREFRDFFEAEHIEKTGQNIKFDLKILKRYGVEIKGNIFDTMLAHYLLQPEARHNLDALSRQYLQYQPVPIENLIGKKGKKQGSMRDVEIEKIKEYAVEDADLCLQLRDPLAAELQEKQMQKLFYEVETPLIRVLADMEIEGIKVDADYLKKLTLELNKDLETLEEKIYKKVGKKFNLASPKQLGEILFGEMKLLKNPKKTKTGQYATGEEILTKLAKEHPLVADMLDWRGMMKLKNTYTEALPQEIRPETGRVHTTFLQTVTATGRLSSNNPNIQNIPIRTERGRQVRKAFVPRSSEYVLLAADYSQIELRIIAELSGDGMMKESFLKGEDIHRATAARLYHVPPGEVTREQRSHAKTVNFGIIYGVSAFGLSNQTGLSRAEAKELIDLYFKTYPGLKQYIDKQIAYARENGYVKTLLGRRRYLPNINSRNHTVRSFDERNAVNAPVQGSAADIIKLAMLRVHAYLNEGGFRSKMLLQIHDELIFDIYKPELPVLQKEIKEIMENVYPLSIPLRVDAGTGENWLEAH